MNKRHAPLMNQVNVSSVVDLNIRQNNIKKLIKKMKKLNKSNKG